MNKRNSFQKTIDRGSHYLIICEGEETEPNYFEAIKRILPPDMVNRITISGTGRNTRGCART